MYNLQKLLKEEVSQEIEILRQKLQRLVHEKKERLLDQEVILLSQEIDELIVKYQKAAKDTYGDG
ncbi:aspartyl-phosphate phosphatase Spo0E family protein [Dendrosporobacter sp. 1207_IL3150]|uniref:aspartyl-phosphate phosphatase Spo0E family protein n=1 Tax=Dendrosporobacter sp. 1207_IL3150 TaxID=3084054 RepID=UPI002FD8E621